MRKLLVLLAALMLLVAACGGDDGGGTETEDTGGDEAAAPAGGTTITASNFAFDPTELEVASGDTLTFVNEDEDTEHSFTIDEGVDEEVDGPGEVDITIDLDAGDYDFYCKYHKDSMTGTLTVS